MKAFLIVVASLVLAAAGYDAAIPYFSYVRTISVASPPKQNYVVLDADVFQHAQPAFPDIRIYDGTAQVPYVLVRQGGGSSTRDTQARILNLGSAQGHTEFDVDTNGIEPYDHLRLELGARNFINNVRIEGRRALNDHSGTDLGSSTLYDFTKEGLGSNFILKFSASAFPYIHIRLAQGIAPDQVKAAYLSSFSETKADWSQAGECNSAAGAARQSLFRCSSLTGMPVERISFSVAPGTVNFNRSVVLADEHGNEFQRGSISRVRINRAGQTVTSEDLDLEVFAQSAKLITVTIENGDDPPLPISDVRLLSVERRLYFDPKGKSSLQLYYGDPKLEAPSYDYAKFFQQATDAVPAQLGPAQANPQFTDRPDDRPWSERNSYVLWIAMVLAVVVLGGLALRGLKRPAA